MKIRMTNTVNGSPNGTHVLEYKKDQEYVVDNYPLPFSLAEAFLQAGFAIQIQEASTIRSIALGPTELKSDQGDQTADELSEGDVSDSTPRRGRQKRGMTDALPEPVV